MKLVSTAIRWSTFILAISGVLAMGVVLQQIRSQEASIPPQPVAPLLRETTPGGKLRLGQK